VVNHRAPDVIEQLAMPGERSGGEIAAFHPRGLVREEGVEDVAAGAAAQGQWHACALGESREPLAEEKRAGFDACPYLNQQLAGAAQVGFVWDPRQARAVTHTLDAEVELDAEGCEKLMVPSVGQTLEIRQFIHYHLDLGRFAKVQCAIYESTAGP